MNDPQRVSANLLRAEDVQLHIVEWNRIVVITVPEAPPACKPVYLGRDPLIGAYRRSGEGDYRCMPAEVQAMLCAARSAR